MTNIPVLHYVDRQHSIREPGSAPANMFVGAEPCIEVGFFFDQRFLDRETNKISHDRAVALIDTGADGIFVSPHLIKKYNCPVAEGGHDMSINGVPGAKAHRGSLVILENLRVIDLYVIAKDFRAEGKPFDIVLGRRFLQFCKLTWDGPLQTVAVTIGDNARAF